MKIKILSIGHKKADPLDSIVQDYLLRIKKILPLEDEVMKTGSSMLSRLKKEKNSTVVALDEKGQSYSSVQFSQFLENSMIKGCQSMVFSIGPAEGHCDATKALCDHKISLSKMTLPHRFARLFLCEQIYRGLCIIKNIPYHK